MCDGDCSLQRISRSAMPVYFATEDGVAKRDCSPNLHTAVKLLSSFQSATSITTIFAIPGHIFFRFCQCWVRILDVNVGYGFVFVDVGYGYNYVFFLNGKSSFFLTWLYNNQLRVA